MFLKYVFPLGVCINADVSVGNTDFGTAMNSPVEAFHAIIESSDAAVVIPGA